MTIDPDFLERGGYRIARIAPPEGAGGWYYGRPGPDGRLVDKVGPFESSAQAVKHLEEELFGDDED